ncbi:MAG: hypothetical protein ACFFCP_19240, partial [Promethearchaeota archaeon]
QNRMYMGMSLIEYVFLVVIVVVAALLYQVTKSDSRNRGFSSESERVRYRAEQNAERVTNEETERARRRARQARRYYR